MNFPMRAKKVPIWQFHRTRSSGLRSQLIGRTSENKLYYVCLYLFKAKNVVWGSIPALF
jgi:hypothetical protein